jgi:DNA-binding response OmpR family regulator
VPNGSMACRVIIVEDHPESAEGLAELMALWGYEPHVAGDGRRALELVEAVDPHVVIADIGLPGMDGHELARRIRRGSGGSDIFLVALSGASDEDGAYTESGFDHRLVKPVDLDILERLLDAQTRRSIAT